MRFTEEQEVLLKEVLSRHAQDLVSKVSAVELGSLGGEELERVREALEFEFCETGIGDNDEPNERGQTIESMIEILPLSNRNSLR